MIPFKPFDTYKWRWLSVAPTENLLNPPVLLGVLRVLSKYEGQSPAIPQIAAELKIVQSETSTPIDLVRTPDRNLIRNSGQYWKGTGLLAPDHGKIRLTSLGRKIAEGRITQAEFAAIMIQQTVLPNSLTYNPAEIDKWKTADLKIYPFALIIAITEKLKSDYGDSSAGFLSPRELVAIVIPLAGMKMSASEISSYVILFRQEKLDISLWPDCAPEANDFRLAREFLLFLANFSVCRKMEGNGTRYDERYYFDEMLDANGLVISKNASIFNTDKEANEVVEAIRNSSMPSIIERQRIAITILSRPGQPKFRKLILKKSENKCLLTGERIKDILEAAHIIPVTNGGTDQEDNGICLRVDIHRLFDSGNIRIKPTGELKFSDIVKSSNNYNILPDKVDIPSFINVQHIEWRDKYL